MLTALAFLTAASQSEESSSGAGLTLEKIRSGLIAGPTGLLLGITPVISPASAHENTTRVYVGELTVSDFQEMSTYSGPIFAESTPAGDLSQCSYEAVDSAPAPSSPRTFDITITRAAAERILEEGGVSNVLSEPEALSTFPTVLSLFSSGFPDFLVPDVDPDKVVDEISVTTIEGDVIIESNRPRAHSTNDQVAPIEFVTPEPMISLEADVGGMLKGRIIDLTTLRGAGIGLRRVEALPAALLAGAKVCAQAIAVISGLVGLYLFLRPSPFLPPACSTFTPSHSCQLAAEEECGRGNVEDFKQVLRIGQGLTDECAVRCQGDDPNADPRFVKAKIVFVGVGC